MESLDPGKKTVNSLCRILVAEDNPINLKMTTFYLDSLKIAYDSVGNGLEVLKALERQSYALILMDCLMPELDGYETTDRIRQHRDPAVREIPIIGVTSQGLNNDASRCLDAGMNDCLSKPLRLVALESNLKKWLPALKA